MIVSRPKINALVFCLRATYMDPWWTFAGVFGELLLRKRNAEFDVYVKLGDVEPRRDFKLTVSIIDPATGELVAQQEGLTRASADGIAQRVLRFEVEFPREDRYHVDVWLDETYIDAQTLQVDILD